MIAGMHLLSLLIWIPVLGGIITLLSHHHAAKWIALLTALLSLVLVGYLYVGFDIHSSAMQFTEHTAWIPAAGINYDLGVDGISTPLIILSCITTLVVILAAWHSVHEKKAAYLGCFLLTQGMVIGVFAALDSLLFYMFWEAMLIPMYLSIGIWGRKGGSQAAIKFFLYTFLGSLLLLAALMYLRFAAGSFAILSYYPLKLSLVAQLALFTAFLFAFAVKIPLWPLHAWWPDTAAAAPAGGSVVLGALMVKLGAYGLLRFMLPITPDACHSLSTLMIVLSLIAIVYVGLLAIVQADMKRLVAYSSIAHMGFVSLGCFIIYWLSDNAIALVGLEGGMMQMVTHAFSSGALFIGIGMLYDRLHSQHLGEYSGIARSMPVFASLFMLFAMSNVGLPGTAGFVGEFMVILSLFKAHWAVAFAAALTLVIAAAYTLWLYKRVFFGEASSMVASLKDIQGVERFNLSLLAFGVIVLGVYPDCLLKLFHASSSHLLTLSLQTKL